ncbi:hypothetical protein BDV18DRAFT_142376 [Aspergillus unguis]
MRCLENHIGKCGQYYAHDNDKMFETCCHLSEEIAPEGAWPECLLELEHSQLCQPRSCGVEVQSCRQQRQQPVSIFAVLLDSLASNWPCLVSDHYVPWLGPQNERPRKKRRRGKRLHRRHC